MVGFAVWIGDHFLTVISKTSRPRPRGHLSSSHGGEFLREEKSAFLHEDQEDPERSKRDRGQDLVKRVDGMEGRKLLGKP